MTTNKELSATQKEYIAKHFNSADVRGYARVNADGSVFDYQVWFEDGGRAWLTPERGLGKRLATVK